MQAADSESRIAGFDLQHQLSGGQLVVEVECRGNVRRRNQLRIVVQLFGCFLKRLQFRLLHRGAFHQLLPKHLHLPHVALLHFLPFAVRFHCSVQVPVDGPAGKIVADRILPVGLRSLGNRIYLLVDADRYFAGSCAITSNFSFG